MSDEDDDVSAEDWTEMGGEQNLLWKMLSEHMALIP